MKILQIIFLLTLNIFYLNANCKVTKVASNDTLSVRENATVYSKKVGELSPNTVGINVIRCIRKAGSSPWCKINYSSGGISIIGWVNSRFLNCSDNSYKQNINTTCKVIKVASDDTLSVREHSTVNSKKVGTLSPYAKGLIPIKCIKKSGSSPWCKINYSNGGLSIIGWVNSKFLSCSSNNYKKEEQIDSSSIVAQPALVSETKTPVQVTMQTKAPKVVKKQPTKPKVSTGTGFFITPSQVITNNHVTNSCKYIIVKRNGYKSSATIRAKDEKNDLSILDIQKENINILKFRASKVSQGENVLVMGYPLGSLLGNNLKLTSGMINALNGFNNDATKYQISAPIQHGNSGGPLLDMSGLVIGVVYGGLNQKDAQNVNFAIKASVVKMFLDANGVEYEESNKEQSKQASEVFKESKKAVVRVICKKR